MYLLFTVALPLISPSPAEAPIVALRTACRPGQDMVASFRQVYDNKLLQQSRTESGKLWLKADGRVRWSYRQPVRKDFVFDGRTAYFYEPSFAQVTVFEDFSQSALFHSLQFILNGGDAVALYSVSWCHTDCPDTAPGQRLIELAPREGVAAVSRIHVIIDASGKYVRRSVVYDGLGNRTTYLFSDVVFGASLPDAGFVFNMPDGVNVLRATDRPSADKKP